MSPCKLMTKWRARHTFKMEISLVLIFKVLFLTLLWYAFFSDPIGDHLNDQKMGKHFISAGSHSD